MYKKNENEKSLKSITFAIIMRLLAYIIFTCFILETILCNSEKLYLSDTKNVKIDDDHIIITTPNNLIAKNNFEDNLDKYLSNSLTEQNNAIKYLSINLYKKEFAPLLDNFKNLNGVLYLNSDILISYSNRNYDVSYIQNVLCKYMESLFSHDFELCINDSGTFNFSTSSWVYDSEKAANHFMIDDPNLFTFVNTKDNSQDMVGLFNILNNNWRIDQNNDVPNFFIGLKFDFENNRIYIEKMTYLDQKTPVYLKIHDKDIEVTKLVNKNCKNLDMKRSLKKDGLHRELITEINLPDEEIDKYLRQGCTFALVETFSNSIFIDRYELEEHERFGGASFFIFKEIDLEKPSYFSTQNIVIIESKSRNITIPIHFRYQMPSNTKEYIEVFIKPPRVFIQCSKDYIKNNIIDLLNNNHEEIDLNKYIELIPSNRGPLVAEIPTGRRADENIVHLFTNLLPILGSLFIIYVIFKMSSKNVMLHPSKID